MQTERSLAARFASQIETWISPQTRKFYWAWDHGDPLLNELMFQVHEQGAVASGEGDDWRTLFAHRALLLIMAKGPEARHWEIRLDQTLDDLCEWVQSSDRRQGYVNVILGGDRPPPTLPELLALAQQDELALVHGIIVEWLRARVTQP